ncbi:ATP-dependent zinc metalloprotease FtsH [Eubacterium sp.]|uniref:ATP-dependent zinc metalloprotease FtsH n=1 Tax=Eubacterium sp. TaxID=142586 RepID=UPI0025E60602|nr:ATP-dependent zinc metalloprotease FtsH [Eubacterium sp.]MDD7331740.1 ATP-dependent zinc metalloprotease FtsH [Eubacterium sp.]MDY3812382.1 ATP-dependent zinc metalloprotease FtsH [Eubacterium sp.]
MRKNMSQNWKAVIFYILIPVLLIGSIFLLSYQNKNTVTTNYSEIVNLFRNDKVESFELDLSTGELNYKLRDDDKTVNKYSVPSVSYFIDDISEYVDRYNDSHQDTQITYNYKKGSSNSWWMSMLPTFIFTVIIILMFVWLMRRMSSSIGNETNRTLGFGKIKSKNSSGEESDKKFEDVAGCDEEKAELAELVDFLKNGEKYTELGARIPKGVLLVGPPGTGKTLLAKAVAGEAGVPFLSISGSDFVEMYVGVGASRVRDLFEQAKKKSPCIVFIDEIDAVGRHRGTGMGGGNDEREQTLNQLLVEMDGFGSNTGVIVIAATNRPDVLDPALLRPGRFDRQITVNRPDAQGREDILKVHSKNKPLAPDVDLHEIAKLTIGFTGADLENLMNEAALLAVRNGRKAIVLQDIMDASSRVELGTEKKSHKFSDKAKKLTAFHEAGHAVSAYYTEGHDPVKEISIIPRGLGAGGYTWYTPQEENYNSRKEMLDNLVSMFGGRVAEALALDDISTGASNDLQRATEIVRDMVIKYGMSDSIGPVVYDSGNGEVFLGKDYGHVNNYSEETSARIDAEVEKIMRQAYDKTVEILKEHYDKLELVANALLKKEKINGEEFENLMKYGTLEAPKDETAANESENALDTVTENETDSSVDIPDNSNEENKNE